MPIFKPSVGLWRAMQSLTRRWRLRFLRYKIIRSHQGQQLTALDGMSFSYFTRTCGLLQPRTIWALASSPHPSAILNVFGLIVIETTSRGCFNHAHNNHVSTMIWPMECLMWTLHTPYCKMAANKLFFCLHVNERSLPRQHVKNPKNFEVTTRRRGLINMQTKE